MNIIFSDIDGTFYEMGHDIPAINLAAMDQLKQQGDRFVFVSGRSCTQIENMLKDLGKECDFIFGNGAGYKIGSKPPTFESYLSIDIFAKVIAILEEQQTFYHIHTDQAVYLKPMSDFVEHIANLRMKLQPMGEQGQRIMDAKEEYFSTQCEYIEGDVVSFFKERPELKILKVELMESNDSVAAEIVKQVQPLDANIFSSFITGLEIVNPNSNKGNAINQYLAHFSDATSYGFGDAENDLPMFEAVDVSIAMANADEAIKEVCDELAGDCSAGGLGQHIFDYLILDKEA